MNTAGSFQDEKVAMDAKAPLGNTRNAGTILERISERVWELADG